MIPDTYNIKKVYKGSVEQLQEELSDITLENVKSYKAYKGKCEDICRAPAKLQNQDQKTSKTV